MAGQENYLYLTQENYFDKSESDLIQGADLYYLNKKFGVGNDVDKDRIRHAQLFYNILCTDECELIEWVNKKINGDLEDIKYKSPIKNFRIYDEPYGQDDSNKITECCDWSSLEW
jgi:hypothetical protein